MTKQKQLETNLRKQIHKLELENARLSRDNKSLQQQLRVSKRLSQLLHQSFTEAKEQLEAEKDKHASNENQDRKA